LEGILEKHERTQSNILQQAKLDNIKLHRRQRPKKRVNRRKKEQVGGHRRKRRKLNNDESSDEQHESEEELSEHENADDDKEVENDENNENENDNNNEEQEEDDDVEITVENMYDLIDFSEFEEKGYIENVGEFEKEKRSYSQRIEETQTRIHTLEPNFKAVEQYDKMEKRVKDSNQEIKDKRKQLQQCVDQVREISEKRTQLFLQAFETISRNIKPIYSELTKTDKYKMGGQAFLSLGSNIEPFNNEITYHAMPPMKPFREMQQLSGGEKSVASLALLFAIHSYHASPFFILDEIDAALDSENVRRVSDYIRKCASDNNLQTIVISLKDKFYCKADALIGVCKDRAKETSLTLAIDLTKYD